MCNTEIRQPVVKRTLVTRNAINKDNFPTRKEPKYLQLGDTVYDTIRKTKFLVPTNDQFEGIN